MPSLTSELTFYSTPIIYEPTNQTPSEQILQKENQALRMTLRCIADAVMVTDKTGCVRLMNPAAEAMTGWHCDEAIGLDLTTVFTIINEDSRLKVENPVRK